MRSSYAACRLLRCRVLTASPTLPPPTHTHAATLLTTDVSAVVLRVNVCGSATRAAHRHWPGAHPTQFRAVRQRQGWSASLPSGRGRPAAQVPNLGDEQNSRSEAGSEGRKVPREPSAARMEGRMRNSSGNASLAAHDREARQPTQSRVRPAVPAPHWCPCGCLLLGP